MLNSHNFNATTNGIVELRADEIEQIEGGIAPLIAVAYFGIGLSGATLAGGGGFLLGLRLSQH